MGILERETQNDTIRQQELLWETIQELQQAIKWKSQQMGYLSWDTYKTVSTTW